jgi:dTDP-4-dehydrorhamnose reductase
VNNSKSKLLIIGASGFLGRALMNVPDIDIDRIPATRGAVSDFPDSVRLDLTRPDEVMAAMVRIRPDWVINAAADTGVDKCEGDPERTRLVHVGGTRDLARACEKTGAGLISISTNYVFDGEAGPYDENDETNPLNVYGRTKLEAESIVLDASSRGVVVRTAVLYGYHVGSRPNFVTWAINSLSAGKPIRVVTDECTNPTQVDELARFLLSLCKTDFGGIIHFAGVDYLSRYQMVERICKEYNLDLELVTPVASVVLGQVARRPLQAGLRIDRLDAQFKLQLRTFEEHLKDLVEVLGR